MIPATGKRVVQHTSDSINRRIRRRTERNVARYAHASKAVISHRLRELDGEWDIERALETNAATMVLIGMSLGAGVDRKWYVLPALVAAFLLQHAAFGWCPPVPILRRMGFRTAAEINRERTALRIIRGDFEDLEIRGAPDLDDVRRVLVLAGE